MAGEPQAWTHAAQGVAPSSVCQTVFLSAASAVLLIQALPTDLRKSLMDYGARRRPGGTGGKPEGQPAPESKGSGASAVVTTSVASSEETSVPRDTGTSQAATTSLEDRVAAWTDATVVPHSWFNQFYLLSVTSSLFWIWQLAYQGNVMKTVARWETDHTRDQHGGMSIGQVYLLIGLMGAQGLRRLYECYCVHRPGTSPMLALHWIMGLLFYLVIGAAVWIEGSAAILRSWSSPNTAETLGLSYKHLAWFVVYLFGYINQYRCHKYLAGLRKYTFPNDGWFKEIVCPHYTCECLIYLSMAGIGGPAGTYFNKSVGLGALFVATNLGITAKATREWNAEKFGQDKVAEKWDMIPGMF